MFIVAENTGSVNIIGLRSSLFWKKKNDDALVKITFKSHFVSRRHDVIKLSIADISLILLWIELQFSHRDQGSPWCHLKYHVILKVTLTVVVNYKVNACSFLSFGLSIHNYVSSLLNHFKISTVVVEKRNFQLQRYYVINIFKFAYLRYLLSDWAHTSFSKIWFIICICILKWYVIK